MSQGNKKGGGGGGYRRNEGGDNRRTAGGGQGSGSGSGGGYPRDGGNQRDVGQGGRPGGSRQGSGPGRNERGQGDGGQFRPSRPKGDGFAQWTSEPLPHEKSPTVKTLKWKTLASGEKNITLPAKKDAATAFMSKISLKVNHFPIEIKFPKTIFLYKVKISKIRANPGEGPSSKVPTGKKSKAKRAGSEADPGDEAQSRPLPKYVTAEVLKSLIKVIHEKYRIVVASDRKDVLICTKRVEEYFNIQTPIEVKVRIDGPQGSEETFSVEIQSSEDRIDSGALQHFVDKETGYMKGKVAIPDLIRVDQIYNILLKNLSNSSYTPIGRSSLICFSGYGTALGGGLMNYQGFDVVAGISGCWKPLINIHVANCATVVGRNVIDIFAELFNDSRDNCLSIEGWKEPDFRKATNLLRSCRVNYSPKAGKTLGGAVTKLENRSVSAIQFPQEVNGVQKMTSVYDYFVRQYGTKLNKNGACLLLGKNHVPAELCTVKKGQSVNRGLTLDAKQTSQMLRCAKKDPSQLVPQIESSIKELGLNSDPVLKEFGVTVANNASMLSMPETRVLAPPMICYGGRANDNQKMRVTPDQGQWNNWNLNARFLEPSAPVAKWGILMTCAVPNQNEAIGNFVKSLRSKSETAGMNFRSEPVLKMKMVDNRDPMGIERYITALTSLFESANDFGSCQIVLVVVPCKAPCDEYTYVKQAAELRAKTRILTQCVSREKFTQQWNSLQATVGNLILKMNSKLGGINHVVCSPKDLAVGFNIFQDPVMIIGADVTHPSLGSGREGEILKSYAAVTCSIDKTGMPFRMSIQAQTKAEKDPSTGVTAAEVVQNFDVIIKNCLQYFKWKTGLKPVKIIYYRDGVGQGQFPELLHKELRQIRKGCTEAWPTEGVYEPAITFITVQKRHKTRFFVDNPNGYQNPPPGTVVDTEIVHPTEHDFYLVSHYGALGTSRPTRYHVLWDDSDFTSDVLQQLTYYLCFMYVRCTKAVSIPAPTYYAHWAAKRAKVLAERTSEKTVEEVNKILDASKGLLRTYPMHFI